MLSRLHRCPIRWALAAAVSLSCSADPQGRFPLRTPLAVDPDRQPFSPPPPESFSPKVWDAVDNTFFRPVTRALAVETSGESLNVNALDEVPDSSWFTNRIGVLAQTPAGAALGACEGVPPPRGPYTILSAKPDGANPGAMVEDANGQKYLLKFEDRLQPERASSADVLGAAIFHAAGYFVPCNTVVFLDADELQIKPGAKAKDHRGHKVPFTRQRLERLLRDVPRMPDGRYRANVSRLLDGTPLGPWSFVGTRDGDPNDVIPHEDRREVRGMYVLCAWVSHPDAREQNTLSVWIEVPGEGGYVRHALIDWGDGFGLFWPSEEQTRRSGHAYGVDFGQIGTDFVTLGTITRPWDVARFGPAGATWGYYNVESFEPDAWKAAYPVPPFSRMAERDAAWMARILARFTDAHVDALVDRAMLSSKVADRELRRILKGRRDKLLLRYLTRLSPLSSPRVERGRLCLEDRLRGAGLAGPAYTARVWTKPAGPETAPVSVGDTDVCIALPNTAGASPSSPKYVITEFAGPRPIVTARVRIHLYDLGRGDFRVVGLERPELPLAP